MVVIISIGCDYEIWSGYIHLGVFIQQFLRRSVIVKGGRKQITIVAIRRSCGLLSKDLLYDNVGGRDISIARTRCCHTSHGSDISDRLRHDMSNISERVSVHPECNGNSTDLIMKLYLRCSIRTTADKILCMWIQI